METYLKIKDIYAEKADAYYIFTDSTITQSFITAGIIKDVAEMDRIFLRKYQNRYYRNEIEINQDGAETGTALTEIQEDIQDLDYIYKYKYDKLLKTLTLEYNPIWNKDGTITHEYTRTPNLETETTKGTQTELTHNTKNARSGTDTTTLTHNTTIEDDGSTTTNIKNNQTQTVTTNDSTSQTRTPNLTTVVQTDVSPYNGGEYMDTKTTTTETGTETTANGGGTTQTTSYTGNSPDAMSGTNNNTNTTTGTETTAVQAGITTALTGTDTTKNTGSDTTKETGTDNITETTTEQGNIGVTTTQAMINEERNISDFEIIFEYLADVAKYITLKTYKIFN